MRCSAPIRPQSLLIRSRNSPTDPTCQRTAVDDGLCVQHAAVKRRHREQSLAVHRRIVARILSIPPRD